MRLLQIGRANKQEPSKKVSPALGGPTEATGKEEKVNERKGASQEKRAIPLLILFILSQQPACT